MKHIKQFESLYNNSMYWLLPTDERFEDSLKQIKCDGEMSKMFLNSINPKKEKYVFIGYSKYYGKGDDDNWGWNAYKGKMTDDFYEEKGYEFMGTVNIDFNDIEFAVTKFNI